MVEEEAGVVRLAVLAAATAKVVVPLVAGVESMVGVEVQAGGAVGRAVLGAKVASEEAMVSEEGWAADWAGGG